MMVPWFYPRDSWQSFIRLATHCLWYQSFDVSAAAVPILESVAEPNLTSEKFRCETTAVFDIPNCWHIHSPQYFTSYDLSTKTTSLYNKSYKKICAMFTSRTTIYRLTSLTISCASRPSASARLRPTKLWFKTLTNVVRVCYKIVLCIHQWATWEHILV